jgi:hypothetical protein
MARLSRIKSYLRPRRHRESMASEAKRHSAWNGYAGLPIGDERWERGCLRIRVRTGTSTQSGGALTIGCLNKILAVRKKLNYITPECRL